MANKLSSITISIKTQANLDDAMRHLSLVRPALDKPFTFTLNEGEEARSLKQNRLSFMWYKFRGNATGHGHHYERALCKLMYGCPILCEDKQFNEFYLTALAPLEWEQRIDAMEYVPVTSLMKVRQFAEYLTIIDQRSAVDGIVLPRPEDLYFDALMIEADQRC